MQKLLTILFAIGPAALFFSISYLIKHPDDWTGPAIIIPLATAITLTTQLLGIKKIKNHGIQIGATLGGTIAGIMTYWLV